MAMWQVDKFYIYHHLTPYWLVVVVWSSVWHLSLFKGQIWRQCGQINKLYIYHRLALFLLVMVVWSSGYDFCLTF